LILIDSCGWLEFLADGPLAEDFAPYFKKPEEIITPAIVIYEVTKKIWQEQGKEKALLIAAQMQQTKVVSLDISLALGAAEVAIRYGLPMADAIIYATGSAYGCPVVTTDQHFKDLPGVIYFTK